jgi:hypothetical protein
MDKQEETTRLSEDPRFIDHVKIEIAKVQRHVSNFEDTALMRGRHRKRDGWDRFCDMALNEPSACAKEYELCLVKKSQLPATVRRVVTHIGANALSAYARSLAQENNQEKEV